MSLLSKQLQTPKSLLQTHSHLLTSGLLHDPLTTLTLAKSFILSNQPDHAYRILEISPSNKTHNDPFFFNSLISRIASREAVSVYKTLVGFGFLVPNRYTFPALLKCCAKGYGVEEGRQVHGFVVKSGFAMDAYVGNGLVYMYGVCGVFRDALKVFDGMGVRDVVSWTGLISGYVKGGLFQEALRLFEVMDVEPNMATLVCVLVACGRLNRIGFGRRIHGLVLKKEACYGLVVGNALLDMYVKCGKLDEAKQVFEELSCRDIVSWTSIISGFAQCNRPKEAIDTFHEMQACGVEPDKVTLSSVLSACASFGALDTGKWVHDYIERKGIKWDVHLSTSLVDMYAKNGCIEIALSVFNQVPIKNVSCWNALLGGLAMHGHGKTTLVYYNQMLEKGFVPNDITSTAVLNACAHSGLVEEGRKYFNSMTSVFNLTPRIEHYGCMVDLLGRAGLLEEALDLIKNMPLQADVFIWGSILSACKAHGNVELSEKIQNCLLEAETVDSGVYVLLSNIYASSDRWLDVTRTRRLMKNMGVKKEPGSSVIGVYGCAHEFLVGDGWNHHQDKNLHTSIR